MFCFDKENDMGKFVPFIVRSEDAQRIDVKIRRMNRSDAKQTEKEPVWQTSWMSDYMQDAAFEKYALKTAEGELVALAAYEILENDVMVHITYIESQPESNPTIVGRTKKYQGIGRVLIAYGIKLSIDHECEVLFDGGKGIFCARYGARCLLPHVLSGLPPVQCHLVYSHAEGEGFC